jgi:hypothetical protein
VALSAFEAIRSAGYTSEPETGASSCGGSVLGRGCVGLSAARRAKAEYRTASAGRPNSGFALYGIAAASETQAMLGAGVSLRSGFRGIYSGGVEMAHVALHQDFENAHAPLAGVCESALVGPVMVDPVAADDQAGAVIAAAAVDEDGLLGGVFHNGEDLGDLGIARFPETGEADADVLHAGGFDLFTLVGSVDPAAAEIEDGFDAHLLEGGVVFGLGLVAAVKVGVDLLEVRDFGGGREGGEEKRC